MTDTIPVLPEEEAPWTQWGAGIDAAARAAMKWCGPFAVGVMYETNDVVLSGGVLYVCTVAHLSTNPPPDVNSTLWADVTVPSVAPTLATIPAGSVISTTSTATRPTSRTDVTVLWLVPGSAPAAMLPGDVQIVTG